MAEAGEGRQRSGSTGSPESRLSLKPIKIPMGDGDEGDDAKSRRVTVEARVECNIGSKGLGCSTVFKGQMRAQLEDQGNRGNDSDKNKTSNLKNGSEGGSEATCPVCSRSFHSKKAMYGHMRCHPEREWRGINPPPSAKPASSSSVSQEIDGLSHSSMTLTVVSSDTSPLQPRRRWTKTGRRGQNRIIKSYSTSGSSSNISSLHNKGIEEKHPVPECVGLQKRQQIKMLPVGKRMDYPSKKLKIDERGASGSRGQEDAGNKSGASCKDFLKTGFNLGPTEVDTDKKRTEDRIIPEGQLDDQIAKNTMTEKLARYFNVSDDKPFLKTVFTCTEVFPTYQALGGNRSSHSYEKNGAMKKQYASSSHSLASEEKGLALGTSKQVVQKAHKCPTCNMTFPTGQALGGHQTAHRQKPAQLATPKEEASQSTGPRVVFDFDLNELPPMEKE